MRDDDFERFVAEHSGAVYAFVRSRASDRDMAAELTHETFVLAWQRWRQYRGDAAVRTWLIAIALNVLRDHERRLSRRRSREGDLDEVAPDPQDSSRPDIAAELSDRRRRVRAALANLPDDMRQVLELRYFADLKYDDIARMLNVPTGTVASRIHRALGTLGGQLYGTE